MKLIDLFKNFTSTFFCDFCSLFFRFLQNFLYGFFFLEIPVVVSQAFGITCTVPPYVSNIFYQRTKGVSQGVFPWYYPRYSHEYRNNFRNVCAGVPLKNSRITSSSFSNDFFRQSSKDFWEIPPEIPKVFFITVRV